MWCWSGGRGILTELSLCYSIVYHIMVQNGTSSSYRSVNWLRVWSCLILLCVFWAPLYLRSLWCYICWKMFLLHSLLYLLVSWTWWPLNWLTNHCPSVLWHCWLGHLTRLPLCHNVPVSLILKIQDGGGCHFEFRKCQYRYLYFYFYEDILTDLVGRCITTKWL